MLSSVFRRYRWIALRYRRSSLRFVCMFIFAYIQSQCCFAEVLVAQNLICSQGLRTPRGVLGARNPARHPNIHLTLQLRPWHALQFMWPTLTINLIAADYSFNLHLMFIVVPEAAVRAFWTTGIYEPLLLPPPPKPGQ